MKMFELSVVILVAGGLMVWRGVSLYRHAFPKKGRPSRADRSCVGASE